MRYLGIVWGPGYPREQVGAVLHSKLEKALVCPPEHNKAHSRRQLVSRQELYGTYHGETTKLRVLGHGDGR